MVDIVVIVVRWIQLAEETQLTWADKSARRLPQPMKDRVRNDAGGLLTFIAKYFIWPCSLPQFG